MPSWPIHLAMAKKLNQTLNLSNDFIIGNVLPDVLNGYEIENPSYIVHSDTTHYRLNKHQQKYNIHTDYFINQYKENLNNDVILGYLVHLLTDSYFNMYTHQYHIIVKNDQRLTILKNGNILEDKNIIPWQLKQSDFKIFGQKLINDNALGSKPKASNHLLQEIAQIKECPLTENDLNKTIIKINNLIDNKEKYDQKSYQMFTEQELSDLFQACYFHIIKCLNQII